MHSKATAAEIRERFDKDVERFSNLEPGQSATIDAPLVLALMVGAAAAVTPGARRSLDVGSGAGNYTLRLLEELPALDVDLSDLSAPMLSRARERLEGVARGAVNTMQSDMREAELEEGAYVVIMAGATLHRLRGEEEWRAVFARLYAALAEGGSL